MHSTASGATAAIVARSFSNASHWRSSVSDAKYSSTVFGFFLDGIVRDRRAFEIRPRLDAVPHADDRVPQRRALADVGALPENAAFQSRTRLDARVVADHAGTDQRHAVADARAGADIHRPLGTH